MLVPADVEPESTPGAGEQQQPDDGGLRVLGVVDDETETLRLVRRQEARAGSRRSGGPV